MNLLTKILNIIGVIFDFLTNRSTTRRKERREAEKRRNEIVEELRRVNDEMLIRLTEMYRTVNDNNAQIAKLQTENGLLMQKLELTTKKLELLTKQNRALLAELKKRDIKTTSKPQGKTVIK